MSFNVLNKNEITAVCAGNGNAYLIKALDWGINHAVSVCTVCGGLSALARLSYSAKINNKLRFFSFFAGSFLISQIIGAAVGAVLDNYFFSSNQNKEKLS
jgi:uncharacterized membrane protein